jgi:hypothetical protein
MGAKEGKGWPSTTGGRAARMCEGCNAATVPAAAMAPHTAIFQTNFGPVADMGTSLMESMDCRSCVDHKAGSRFPHGSGFVKTFLRAQLPRKNSSDTRKHRPKPLIILGVKKLLTTAFAWRSFHRRNHNILCLPSEAKPKALGLAG